MTREEYDAKMVALEPLTEEHPVGGALKRDCQKQGHMLYAWQNATHFRDICQWLRKY